MPLIAYSGEGLKSGFGGVCVWSDSGQLTAGKLRGTQRHVEKVSHTTADTLHRRLLDLPCLLSKCQRESDHPIIDI